MNKKVLTIVSCLLILAITATLLLIIILGVDKKEDDSVSVKDELTCVVNDLDIAVGGRIEDFYNFNKTNVEVSFELDKVGVIYIDENFIEGLSAGEVTVTIIGKKDDKTCNKQFKVRVSEASYTVKIVPVLNCGFDILNNTIFMEAASCHFNIEIYNEYNIKLNDINYDVSCNNENVILENGLNDYLLISSEDCVLSIKIEHSSILTNINVIAFK